MTEDFENRLAITLFIAGAAIIFCGMLEVIFIQSILLFGLLAMLTAIYLIILAALILYMVCTRK